MPEISLDHHQLESYLPHRGANLMADQVVLNAERTSSRSVTRIPRNDPRGREIFGRTGPGGSILWYEPFLAELMAVTGVPLLKERLDPLGHVAVFSMISRIVFERPAPLYGEIIGHANITRDRSGFTVFSTSATVDGQKLLETEVMSGSASLATVGGTAIRPLVSARGGHAVEPGQFAWKGPALRFLDSVVESDAARGRLVGTYSYPHDHPFVPGHFPGTAVMMGVTQWAMVADAAWQARNAFGYPGGVMAQGVVRRQDGSEIIDVRDLHLAVDGGLPRIASTKRLAFREPMRPGDGVLVEVTVKPA
jgi:3-hydroxymyristoyl/3-hydroxydecanoyl-(acyl carrier protein) dehydratase